MTKILTTIIFFLNAVIGQAQSDTSIIAEFSKVNIGKQIDPEEVERERNKTYEQVLRHIDSIHADHGLKEKVTQLKNQTFDLLEKIDSIKLKLVENFHPDNDSLNFVKDGSASHFKMLLNRYKNNLQEFYLILSEADKNKIEQLLSTNDTSINNKKVTWEDANFQSKPTVVIVALLTKEELEIKKSEQLIIETILNLR